MIVSLFFGVPATALCSIHIKNYIAGQTTNERFAKKTRASSDISTESELLSEDDDKKEI